MDYISIAVANKLNAQRKSQFDDHISDASQHGFYVDRYGKSHRVKSLNLSLSRTGIPWNQVTMARHTDLNTPVTLQLPTVRLPIRTELTNLSPIGVDRDGFVVGKSGGSSIYRKTCDGGSTFTAFTPSSLIVWLWVDAQGNRYISVVGSPSSLWREDYTTDTWEFTKCFDFTGTAYAAQWSFTEDGEGNIWVAEYDNDVTSPAGHLIHISNNWGADWHTVELDYGQKHFHKIHYHKPSGNLYCVVGEGGSWKGLLKSNDKGENWAQVASQANVAQPTSAVTVGNYILWGRDSTPSGFWLHDTATDTLTPVVIYNGSRSISSNYDGFVFSCAVVEDGYVVAPTRSEDGAEHNICHLLAMGDKATPIALQSNRFTETNFADYVFGDAAGNWYVKKDNNSAWAMTSISVGQRMAYETRQAGDLLGIMNYSYPSARFVEYLNGVPCYRYEKPDAAKFSQLVAVTPGDTIAFVAYVKHIATCDGALLLNIRQYETEGGSYTTTQLVARTSRMSTSEYTRITFTYTVPAGVNFVRTFWSIASGTASSDNAVVVAQPVTVWKMSGENDPPYVPDAAHEWVDELSFTSLVSDRFLFRDRIYQRGFGDLWVAGDVPFLAVNNVEIGWRKGATSYDLAVYVKQGGTDVDAKQSAPFGGKVGDLQAVDFFATSGIAYPKQMIPAPLCLGIRRQSVMFYNPETGAVDTIPLPLPIEGELNVKLTGTCYHMPMLFSAVADVDVNHLLLDM